MIKKRPISIIFISLFFAAHYLWLSIWNGGDLLLLLVGDLFTICAALISSIVLYQTSTRGPQLGKPFWLLLSLGCFNFFIAEVIWAYYDVILRIDVPYPGFPDIFYLLQIMFYLTSFLYLFFKLKGTYHLVKIIFDMAILFTVVATFSWIYIYKPIMAIPETSYFFLLVTLGYPIGDLVLIVLIISIYICFDTPLIKRDLLFIFIGLIIQIFADSSYVYQVLADKYFSGDIVDSLYTLALLLVGFSGVSNAVSKQKLYQTPKISQHEKFDFFRMFLPYFSAIILFIFVMLNEKEKFALQAGSFIAMFLIISRQFIVLFENKRNQAKIQYMAYHDSLTELPNRSFFSELLNVEILNARRNQTMLGVMFIDMDRFKTINDTLGHDIGDQLLAMIAKRMKASIRKCDTVGRLSGDEFAIMLKGIRKIEDLTSIANKIQNSLNHSYMINGNQIFSTPSTGISVYPCDSEDPNILLKKADMAMYHVKENGRNHIRFYSTASNGDQSRKYHIEKDLHIALANNELSVYYQPQIEIENGEIIGVEALLRWHHPALGNVPPSDFIPIAEQTGLILPIGEWVLRTACQQMMKWHNSGNQLKLAVNLSPRQFRQKDLVDLVKDVLTKTGLRPGYLDLEITEGVAIGDIALVIQRLQSLKNLGIKISIDDFGTGYSSFSYLAKYPIDTLKIPREFILKIGEDSANDAIIASIIALAQILKINVLAEGVENKEQLKYLKALKCYQIQGYLFGKPVTAKEIEEKFFIKEKQFISL